MDDGFATSAGRTKFTLVGLTSAAASAQSGIYVNSSGDRAMRDAFRKMLHFLMTTHGLTEDNVLSLMSVGTDIGIMQFVDGNCGVHVPLRTFFDHSPASASPVILTANDSPLGLTRTGDKHMRIIVNIDVPELAAAIDFYSTALELELSRIIDDDVAELTGASSVIYLLANVAGSVAASSVAEARRYSRHWTPVHIDFVVDDIVKATDRAIKAGASRESECIDWRGSKCITFSDPFGHGFCLIEFVGETYR